MLLKYAWKAFWRRRSTAILSLGSIAAATALLVAVLSISHGVREAVQDSLDATGADLVIQKRVKPCPFALVKLPKDLGEIDAAVIKKLRQLPEVEAVSGVLMLWAFYDGHPTVLAGIDPHLKQLGPVRLQAPETDEDRRTCCAVTQGRYLSGGDDYHTIITEEYAQAHGYKLADMIPLGPDAVFEVVGIVSLAQSARIAEAEAFVTLDMAQQMYAAGDIVDTIFVALAEPLPARVEAVAQAEIGEGTSITSSQNVDAGTALLASVTRRTLYIISALVLVFVFALIVHSFLAGVARRVPEIGVLKAIGWDNVQVALMFVAEAIYVGIIGGVAGSLLGLLLAWLYSYTAMLELPSALSSYPPCAITQPLLSTQIIFYPSPLVFAIGSFTALVLGAIAGFIAARRAASLAPAEALRRI